jgi:hypothetical protein
MQDSASEVLRIPLPRTWVNNGKKKGRGPLRAPAPSPVPFQRALSLLRVACSTVTLDVSHSYFWSSASR